MTFVVILLRTAWLQLLLAVLLYVGVKHKPWQHLPWRFVK